LLEDSTLVGKYYKNSDIVLVIGGILHEIQRRILMKQLMDQDFDEAVMYPDFDEVMIRVILEQFFKLLYYFFISE